MSGYITFVRPFLYSNFENGFQNFAFELVLETTSPSSTFCRRCWLRETRFLTITWLASRQKGSVRNSVKTSLVLACFFIENAAIFRPMFPRQIVVSETRIEYTQSYLWANLKVNLKRPRWTILPLLQMRRLTISGKWFRNERRSIKLRRSRWSIQLSSFFLKSFKEWQWKHGTTQELGTRKSTT